MNTRPSPEAALSAFIFAAAGLIVSDWLPYLFSGLGLLSGIGLVIFAFVLQGWIFAGPALRYYQRMPALKPAMRLQRFDPLCGLLLLLAVPIGVLALNWITVYWMAGLDALGLSTSTGNEYAPQSMTHLWLMIATSVIAPAIFEEILFRGYLLPSLEQLGERAAILISGAMFALLHGRIEALPAHLLLGMLLALIVLRTGSLYSSILYHAAYNATIMIIAYLVTQSPAPIETEATPAGYYLQMLPSVVAITGLWLALLLAAVRRGERTQQAPLAPARREPLTRSAQVLLGLCAILLLLIELRAFLYMLPGGPS